VLDGDKITIDSDAGVINLNVAEEEMRRRRSAWKRPAYKATRGTLHRYIKTVRTASEGCVTDE
jgi:dihydroxy-acid dehydratase